MQDEIEVQWRKDKDFGNVLLLQEHNCQEHHLIASFAEVFMYYRLNRMIKKIAHDEFYYTDVDEIERICQLTNLVMIEQHFATPLFGRGQTVKTYLEKLLMKQIEFDKAVFFDSIITFNLKPFVECLKVAVGYGIDEMKQEEEFQNFIQSAREFILRREAKLKELFIMQGESFAFYKANGKKYTTLELRTLMFKEPLYVLGLDENEMNLSPVITLLPQHIYVYGDHPADPKTLTLINLFQERVQLFPRDQFPFHLHVK